MLIFEGLNDLAKLAIVAFLIAHIRFCDGMDIVETFEAEI